MAGALAAVMVVVTLSCLARALLPALRPSTTAATSTPGTS